MNDPEVIVNGTGSFPDPGGPYADAGLTGRKIIVDTYGEEGMVEAHLWEDPSKVDRRPHTMQGGSEACCSLRNR